MSRPAAHVDVAPDIYDATLDPAQLLVIYDGT